MFISVQQNLSGFQRAISRLLSYVFLVSFVSFKYEPTA